MKRSFLLLAAALCLLTCCSPQADKWEIRDGRCFHNGKWQFMKIAKALGNLTDSVTVDQLIANLDTLKARHYTAVEMTCYWHHFDPDGDGVPEKTLRHLNRYIDAIYAKGMCPCLGVETYAVGGGAIPEGFWDRYPDAYAVDDKGNRVSDTEYGFGTKVISIFHEGYRETVHRFIREIASGVDTGKILYYETTVEPQYMGSINLCYSESARKEYASWRKENGIDDPASEMPEVFPIPRAFVTNPVWNRFRAQFLAKWVSEDAAAFRSVAGENAYVAADYLDATESSMMARCGDPVEFLRHLEGIDIIQVNWTWHLVEKHINQKAFDRVHQVMEETGRKWAVSEHMTFNGSDFNDLTPEQLDLILDNTLRQGTRFGWEFVNVAPGTRASFNVYNDDWSPKLPLSRVESQWDEWMEKARSYQKGL